MAQRPSLKGKLQAERRAMFADGASPSDADYDRFLDKVRNTPGYEFYTSKTHSNYRSRLRPRREAIAARRVSQSVQATQDDASEGAVGRENDAHTAHWQQWEGVGNHAPPTTPTSDASSSTSSDRAPFPGLDDTTAAELAYGTLAMRAPDVFAQMHAARDPTVTQFEQWAAASGLPAVELFGMFIGFREGRVGLPPGVPGVAREYDDRGCIGSGVVGAEPPATACGMWGETSPVYSGPFQVPYDFAHSF
ncbi:uncharacterized protein TRAVEDRAFT_51804 [Trametes versicolor FP-101664 SS1]|uniref:uncharacterized protein n=1 Tax=Trametes versicolor (strain FP-101664) TaxID=717944 RepID=UPI0004622388|nr:uncharacterized protein TRAVEDRAFT_51804 [Trametes versicolor FP-101664 SS1]EIW54074.1 hypothetical protein TRAVEDRAFT_51804 [Trametes versicolor FP-101664 SS1]